MVTLYIRAATDSRVASTCVDVKSGDKPGAGPGRARRHRGAVSAPIRGQVRLLSTMMVPRVNVVVRPTSFVNDVVHVSHSYPFISRAGVIF